MFVVIAAILTAITAVNLLVLHLGLKKISAQKELVSTLVTELETSSQEVRDACEHAKTIFVGTLNDCVTDVRKSVENAGQHASEAEALKAKYETTIQALETKYEDTVKSVLATVKDGVARCEKIKASAENALIAIEHHENFAKLSAKQAGNYLNAIEDKVKIHFTK